MICSTELSQLSPPTTFGLTAAVDINAFQWLVLLGFPPNLAAAKLMPELFTTDESAGGSNSAAAHRA